MRLGVAVCICAHAEIDSVEFSLPPLLSILPFYLLYQFYHWLCDNGYRVRLQYENRQYNIAGISIQFTDGV